MLILNESDLEKAIRKFFNTAKLPKTNNSLDYDLLVLKASVPAFISALKEIVGIDFCYGFDETKVFTGSE